MADEGVSMLLIFADELRWINIFRIHMQVLFLSDILSASGRIMDGKYLVRRKTNEKWSKLNFPKEQPPNKDFTLWKSAIWQVVPAGGIMDRLGNLTQYGHKIWIWRHDEDKYRLLDYIEGSMDIYKRQHNFISIGIPRIVGCEWVPISLLKLMETSVQFKK